MEDFADAYHVQTKRVCNVFIIRNYWDYHGLFVESDTLYIAN